jgi:hypothetical protein
MLMILWSSSFHETKGAGWSPAYLPRVVSLSRSGRWACTVSLLSEIRVDSVGIAS